ncbi:MAG: hypothetical protein ACOYK9_04940 [Chlamydiia bacterium]
MMNLDRFEKLNIKTPWAPKNIIDRARQGIEAVENAIQERVGPLALKVFSGESEAFIKWFFAIVQEKTLGEGKNHVLISENLRASLKGALTLFESFGIVVQSIPLQIDGTIDLNLLKMAVYPTTMVCIVEPYDLTTGVEQPIEKILEVLGADIHLHLVSQIEFGLRALFPAVNSVQMDPFLFVPAHMSLQDSFDLDQIVALTTTFQEELEASREKTMHATYLRRFFERGVEAIGGKIFFKEQKRHPSVVVFGFEELHGELLAYYLCQKGMFVSIGGADRPSLHQHLIRMGFEEGESATAVHVHFPSELEENGVQDLLEEIEEVLRRTKRAMQRI